MASYRKKNSNEVVEAERWTHEKPEIEGVRKFDSGYYGYDRAGAARKMKKGDWIITTAEGKRIKCRKHFFEKAYEPV